MQIEQQLTNLDSEQANDATPETVDMPAILTYVKYFVEHLQELLFHHLNPLNRAYFGVIFDKVPTYQDLIGGTQKIAHLSGINELFKLTETPAVQLVIPRRIELLLPG